MTEAILIVDDDVDLLRCYKRRFCERFKLICAANGAEGLAACRDHGPFAVVVSDMLMPGMDGATFLARFREQSPDTVRVMLTGNATVESSINAVNTGQIFRFLVKPCSLDMLNSVIETGIAHYRLVTAERELLTKTLSGSVKVLTDVLSLINPTAFGRSSRVRSLVGRLVAELDVKEAWQCEIAATLSQLGCVTLPHETLAKVYANADLSAEELRAFDAHAAVGHDLIANIPRLDAVAKIIAYQNKRFDGTGPPYDGTSGSAIPLGARILKVALDFDALSARQYEGNDAVGEMLNRTGWYDPVIMEALGRTLDVDVPYHVKSYSLDDLPDHTVLADDIRNPSGQLLMARGIEVTPALRYRLRVYDKGLGVRQPISVLIDANAQFATSSNWRCHEPKWTA